MKTYQKNKLTIIWKPEKCTHSAVCAKGLPHVFKPKDRPWIRTDEDTEAAIMEQIAKCPSGALSFEIEAD